MDQGSIEKFGEYVKDLKNIQFLDNTYIEREVVGPWRNTLTISEFIQKYSDIFPIPIDIQRSSILASFAKRSQIMSILAKIDLIDINNNKKENEKQEVIGEGGV